MTGAVGAGWSGRGHGRACDPVIEEFMELGCGRELFMVDGCWSAFGWTGEKLISWTIILRTDTMGLV